MSEEIIFYRQCYLVNVNDNQTIKSGWLPEQHAVLNNVVSLDEDPDTFWRITQVNQTRMPEVLALARANYGDQWQAHL